jgi:hypothetical protein
MELITSRISRGSGACHCSANSKRCITLRGAYWPPSPPKIKIRVRRVDPVPPPSQSGPCTQTRKVGSSLSRTPSTTRPTPPYVDHADWEMRALAVLLCVCALRVHGVLGQLVLQNNLVERRPDVRSLCVMGEVDCSTRISLRITQSTTRRLRCGEKIPRSRRWGLSRRGIIADTMSYVPRYNHVNHAGQMVPKVYVRHPFWRCG